VLLITGAGIWAYSYVSSVDFKVNRLLNEASRDSQEGIGEEILDALGLSPKRESRDLDEAAADLAALGPATVDRLLLALREDDRWQAQAAACIALTRIDDSRIVPALIASLKDGYEDVYWMVAVLADIGDARAIEPLIECLGHQDRSTIAAAANGLSRIGGPRAAEALIELLSDPDPFRRRVAARFLPDLKDPRAVEPLIVALKDENPNVRKVAADSLGIIGDPRAVEPLIHALKDGDLDVQSAAARSLGRLKHPKGVESLIGALKDEDWNLREAAAESLGKTSDPRTVELLIGALKDEDWNVREAAADSLGEIGDPRAIPALKELLSKENVADVCWAAQDAIRAIRKKTSPASQPSK